MPRRRQIATVIQKRSCHSFPKGGHQSWVANLGKIGRWHRENQCRHPWLRPSLQKEKWWRVDPAHKILMHPQRTITRPYRLTQIWNLLESVPDCIFGTERKMTAMIRRLAHLGETLLSEIVLNALFQESMRDNSVGIGLADISRSTGIYRERGVVSQICGWCSETPTI